MITLTNLIYFTTLLISFFLAFYVLFSTKKLIGRVFVLLTVSASGWVFVNFIVDNSTNNETALIFVRLALAFAIFIIIFFWNFAKLFPKPTDSYSIKWLFLSLIPGVIFMPFILTEYNVKSIDVTTADGVVFEPGILYTLVIPFIITFGIDSLVTIVRKYIVSKGVDKVQLFLFGASFITSLVVAVVATIILPLLGFSEIGIVGPLASLIFISTTAYMLLKHGLFDIRVLIGKITYFSLAGLVVYVAFYLFVTIDVFLLGGVYSLESLFLGIFFSLFFVFAYNSYNTYIRKNVESKIINPGYDPNEVITDFNNNISLELDYKENAKYLINILTKTIRPSSKGIIIKHGNIFDMQEGREKINLSEADIQKIFMVFNKINLGYFAIDEFEEGIPQKKSNIENFLNELISIAKENKLSVIVPIMDQEGSSIAMLLLGQKEASIPYTSTEISFLKTLTDIFSVTLARSFLFEEVKEFNKTLQGKVDEATQELAIRNEQLGEQLRKERDMMDILGHELRTPLGTARNALVMMETLDKAGKSDTEKYDKYFDIAIRNIRREKTLLETILQSARLENSRIQMNLEKVAVKDVIDDSITAFQEQAEQKGLDLKVEYEVKNAYVKVDRTAVQQIIDNLVSNAVKYTYEGEVVVKVLPEGDSHIRIMVKDTGEGINEEDLEHIGKKFFRANTHLESEGKIGGRQIVRPGGTGIGLYVIKGLLKEFGSKLEIKSEFGKGSEFSFVLEKLDLEKLNSKKVLAGSTEKEVFDSVKKNEVKDTASKLNTKL